MKIKFSNWTYILMCVMGLLVASCAEDDGDEMMRDLDSNDAYYGSNSQLEGVYEGVWFSISNDKEPIETAVMTVGTDYSLTFSSVPCEEVLTQLSALANVVTTFSLSPKSTQSYLSSVMAGGSDNALYFDISNEYMAFPLNGDADNDGELTINLAPRKSIAVFDAVNRQWGVFLYYSSAVLRDNKAGQSVEKNFDLGYKFISKKRLK